jgi:hypothetical protein
MRRFAVIVCSLLFVCGLGVAQEPAKTPDQGQPTTPPSDVSQDQEMIARKYKQLRDQLLKIADRLEKSGTSEGVRKSLAIRKALNSAKDKDIAGVLERLAELLRKPSLNDLEKAFKQGKDVTADLQQLLLDLLADSEADQIDFLKNMLKELDIAILMEKTAMAKNMSPSVDKEDAAKAQEAATARVQELLKRIQQHEEKMGRGAKPGESKDGKPGQPGEPKDGKPGESKDGESKDGKDGKNAQEKGKKSENDKDSKGDGKQGDKNEKDGKSGDKGSKGDPKDAKSGDQSGKDSKGDPKDGKSGGKDSKGEPKHDKGGDKDNKSDSDQGKQAQNKKDSQGQQGQAQKGQPKKSGQGGEGGEGEQQDQPQQQQQQQQQGEEQESVPGRERIKDANNDQRSAGDKIKKDRRTEAVPDQQEATRKLEEARKRLEEILRQKREEERERVLQDLKERCEKMKRMQEVVKENTIQLEQKIKARPDGKPTRELETAANQQATEEDSIVTEADRAILILETEGSSVALTEVFKQIRNDMTHVSRRLVRTDVGPETQMIEQDIIDTLGEMIEALKQQIKQNRERKDSPPPPPTDEKYKNLINLLAELRMIRSLQLRVNNRTLVWGQRYQGELAQLPEIVTELRDLALRQHRIYVMTDHLAKGRNR